MRLSLPPKKALASHLLILPCDPRLWRVPCLAPVVRGVQPWRAGRDHELLKPWRSTQEVLHKQDEADTLNAPDHGGQALVEEALHEAARDDPR